VGSGAEGDPLTLAVSFDASAFPLDARGAGRYALELVAALARRDDVLLTVLSRRGDGGRWAALGPGTIVESAPASRPMRLAWEQATLPRELGRARVEVHHAPHYTMPLRAPVPCVVTVHDMTFFDHPEWHERAKVPFFRMAIGSAARRAAAIIVPSQVTADRFLDRFSPVGPVTVVPHGVDLARFRPDEPEPGADEAVLRSLGLRRPYILFGPATIEPRKDVPALVRAFDSVAAAHPEVTLVLAGGRGWGWASAERAIASARHRVRIRTLGFVDDAIVPALLRNAGVAAYPSLEEGFGLPALEALACGAPLVTTTGTAMEEVAGDAALLVRPGDESELASALDRLLGGDPAFAGRRESGLRRAALATWEAAAAGHVGAYRSAKDARL
jgi:glycosyltransferase involved in cell wall biosynthesis